jgi:potassium/hydrogen antiporter
MDVSLDTIFIGAGLLLLTSLLASKASNKLGIPALVLFIGIGILAGSEGIGGIYFDNVEAARDLGMTALAFILFAGGLETKWRLVRPVLYNAISLATVGVMVTAVIIGVAAVLIFHFPPMVALLLGAIVSSTDAAAVFSVLRGRGIHLKKGLSPLLELESGTNDPMAVFLTVSLTSLVVKPDTPILPLAGLLVVQMILGTAFGYAAGRGAEWLINRLRLEAPGLYPALTIAAALVSFGGAELLHGNPFLAVYICGITLGNRNFLHKQSLLHFHDGLAWLMQILMFLVLGLLVFPSKLVPEALPSLALALVLVFIARPAAVFVALAFSRRKTNEKHFIAWTGLRGAVPIILAMIPLTVESTPKNEAYFDTIFNVVFFAVIVSVMLQGTLIEIVATRLGVTAPGSVSKTHHNQNTIELELDDSSPAAGKQLVDLRLPRWALLLLVTRHGQSFVPQGSTVLMPGDRVILVTRKEDIADLARYIAGERNVMVNHEPERA